VRLGTNKMKAICDYPLRGHREAWRCVPSPTHL